MPFAVLRLFWRNKKKSNFCNLAPKTCPIFSRFAAKTCASFTCTCFCATKVKCPLFLLSLIGRKTGRNFGRNYLGIFVLHSLYRTTHQYFSPNSSQSITPCLVTAPVTEISKFHLRELLGLGVPNIVFRAEMPAQEGSTKLPAEMYHYRQDP